METGKKLKEDNEKNVIKCPHLASLILLALVITGVLHLTDNNGNLVRIENLFLLKEEQTVRKNGTIPGCNLFSGRWVYDNVSCPLYKQCSFLEVEFCCEKFGRKNLKYQNWRWQPHNCDIPRFNGTALLEKIRGKKLLFVGDSLGRNQWRSMLCLIESYLPPSSSKSLPITGNLLFFHSIEYNATIGFYWAPMLVESNRDDIELHGGVLDRIIRINSIEKHGKHWLDADILVFDSFSWWMAPTMTILWGTFESRDGVYKTVDTKLRRYEMAINTWSDWLEFNINRKKTKVFFMSHSPYHFRSDTTFADGSCEYVTEPIFDENYMANAVNRSMMEIVESAIEKLEQRGVKVEYLNITQLSGYREDARPSIYTIGYQSQSKKPRKYSDCMHWCLPGVPDVWNQLLYAYIMKS